MEIVEPYEPKEFKAYFDARWKLLRKPWGEPKGSEIDDFENISLHVMAREKNKVLGVGRLTYFPTLEGQIRFMGVDSAVRKQKIGTKLLEYLETEAKKLGLNKIFLNARDSAIDFYKSNGYDIEGDPFKGFADIEHVKMSKKI